MSTFIPFEEGVISFTEFCKLDEAFLPHKVSYGTNPSMDNLEWSDIGKSSVTFFKSSIYYYAVFVDQNGLLGFGISDVKSLDARSYGFNRSQAANAALIFNQIIYVLLERIKKERKDEYAFNGFDEKLGRFYSKVVENKKVIEMMNDVGYEIDDTGEYIVLRRK